ncbi:MAG: type II secretion system ATPase GspE [Chlamydiae bacterium]|nr:type II secretion system ATPase GspE [Chlamydiota bacterium]
MENNRLQETADRFGIEILEKISLFPFVVKKVHHVPYEFAKNKTLLPIDEKEGKLIVAICDPFDLESLEEVRLLTGKEVQEVLALKEEIEDAIEKCYRRKDQMAADLLANLKEIGQKEEIDQDQYDLLKEQFSSSPVIQILNAILIEAIEQGASDIHFEPMEADLSVRYRIDGVLQLRHLSLKEYQLQILTRIKVMARLDIAENRLPQDGRIKLKLGARQIDFRVSTIPIVFGERIVLRILDKSNVLLGLHKLGMNQQLLANLKKILHLSEGIILVTGPTGSGKTTTLYSCLAEINSSQINIMTIEDPVEYKLQGMAQIGVNQKIDLTFAKGLRHILRQDPDVIMIGEVRDRETAEIAIQASLTGHLVFTTLHTNDAPSALTRLVDMGIEPYLLSSSVIGVIAQRLVRCICTSCITSYLPSEAELVEIGIKREDLKDGQLFVGQGCQDCFGTGYKGRRGIYEFMSITHSIKHQLLKSADSGAIQSIALKNGMKTLRRDGSLLVVEGVTSSSELLRVTRGCEDGDFSI